MNEYGLKVTLVFTPGACHPLPRAVYHNVTEVHYRYPPFRDRVAVESHIHGTGITWHLNDVAEFWVEAETGLGDGF